MIQELDKAHFSNISHLLQGDLINIEIKGVVQRYNPGCVFVDNKLKPKTAMVWSKAIKGFYFVGDEHNIEFNHSLNSYIDKEITPRSLDLNVENFEFSGTSKKWDITLEHLFEQRNLTRSIQLTYKYKNIVGIELPTYNLPSQYKLMEVKECLLGDRIKNKNFIGSMILDWWETIEDYLNYGTGYCIVKDNQVVSCCISSCITQNEIGSHIITKDKYRKKGLAKALITQFLHYCKEKNLEPYWDCMESNLGSRKLAEICGYKKDFEYKLYSFPLKQGGF